MNIRQIALEKSLAKLYRAHISHYKKMFSTRQKRVANIIGEQSPQFYVSQFPSLIKERQTQFYLKHSKKFPKPSPSSI